MYIKILALDFDGTLAKKGQMEKGNAILATWQPYYQKILKVLSETGYAATVEYNKSFWDFCNTIPQLSPETIKYHLVRQDFEKWSEKTLHDGELARRIRKINKRNLDGEELRTALTTAVSNRFDELERLI